MTKYFKLTIWVISLASMAMTSSVSAADKILRADVTAPGSTSSVLMTVLGKIYARDHGISLQINGGQALAPNSAIYPRLIN